jgi:Raf kinase inhibitor-like YbhB/YbcL family protein
MDLPSVIYGGGRFKIKFLRRAKALKGQNNMTIRSSAFDDNEHIPVRYSCDGDNVNPPLEFSGVPAGTQSLALIVEDPDVPKNLKPDGMFDHWIVCNMLPGTSGIEENSMPPGIQGSNSAGKIAYTGPCPPDREHRYFFKLYALDTMLDLKPGVGKAGVEKAMQGHILSQSELIGRYNRKS